MLKKIISGYEELFSSVLKTILLLTGCTILGAAFVFPLWKFALSFPSAYSITVLSVFFAFLLYWLTKTVIKAGARKSLINLSKFLIIAGGISFSVYLVFINKRFFTIPWIIIMIILYGICSFGIKENSPSTKLPDHEEASDI